MASDPTADARTTDNGASRPRLLPDPLYRSLRVARLSTAVVFTQEQALPLVLLCIESRYMRTGGAMVRLMTLH